MESNSTTPILPDYKIAETSKLIPYVNNARTHSDAQVAKIAASIKEFGFLVPIVLDGSNGIVAGHGRLLAAQKLGIERVPTIDAKHLTEAQKKAYVIADNKIALDAGWDDDLLRVEFQYLDEAGFDLTLTGFDELEVNDLFDSDFDPSADGNGSAPPVVVKCPRCGHEFPKE